MNSKPQLKVSAIKNGTVIDHIPASALFKVIQILNLNLCQQQITFGTNLDSNRLGKKAIIKISERFFQEDEINRIALIAPQAKFNIIKDFAVVDKQSVNVPDQIRGIVKCANPKCITNQEEVSTYFDVIDKNTVRLQCRYCEKITEQDQLEMK